MLITPDQNCIKTSKAKCSKPRCVNSFCELGILEQFATENYTWRLDIVQKLCEYFLSHFLDLKCANISHTTDTSTKIRRIFLWIMYLLTQKNCRIYTKTLYSSKDFVNFVNFSCLIFWAQNVLMPPYCILLLCLYILNSFLSFFWQVFLSTF